MTDEKKTELLPCPKCWSRNVGVVLTSSVREDESGHSVRCAQCGGEGPRRKTRNEAVDAWNATSVDPADVVARLETAEDSLERLRDVAEKLSHPGMFKDQFSSPKLATAAKAAPIWRLAYGTFGACGFCPPMRWDSVAEVARECLRRGPHSITVELVDDWEERACADDPAGVRESHARTGELTREQFRREYYGEPGEDVAKIRDAAREMAEALKRVQESYVMLKDRPQSYTERMVDDVLSRAREAGIEVEG
jgi:hypothetical protein